MIFARRLAWFVLVAWLGLSNTVVAAPSPSTTPPGVVVVDGAVARPLRLDEAALARLPQLTVRADDHGVAGSWRGVSLTAILEAAGAPLGKALHGRNLTAFVRISATDGYQVVYALAELDPAFRDDSVILADRHDGKPLDAQEGPWRVIAPNEHRPARWIRQVSRIEVMLPGNP